MNAPPPFGRPGVFLDRDGSLIEEVGYFDRPEQVELFSWSIDAAVRGLNRAGVRVVIVTNQSGVARGFFSEAIVGAVHRHIAAQLEAGGARIDAYYYGPHHPDGRIGEYARVCDCRKPARGLVDRAERELGIDPRRSFSMGDRWHDVGPARSVGARGILVRTGYGRSEEVKPPDGLAEDTVVNALAAAAGWILRSLNKC